MDRLIYIKMQMNVFIYSVALVVLNVNHIEPVFDNKNMCLNLLKHIFDIEHAHVLPVKPSSVVLGSKHVDTFEFMGRLSVQRALLARPIRLRDSFSIESNSSSSSLLA